MTNRQWLESLSDEEFAKNITKHLKCSSCPLKGCSATFENECFCIIVNWLQAEHKE